MKQSHPNCIDPNCTLCYKEHFAIQDRIIELIGDRHSHPDSVDWLGKYWGWMKERGYNTETSYGWGTAVMFNDDNIVAFVEDRFGDE